MRTMAQPALSSGECRERSLILTAEPQRAQRSEKRDWVLRGSVGRVAEKCQAAMQNASVASGISDLQ